MSMETGDVFSLSLADLCPLPVTPVYGDDLTMLYLEQVKYRYVLRYLENQLEYAQLSVSQKLLDLNLVCCFACQKRVCQGSADTVSVEESRATLCVQSKYQFNSQEYVSLSKSTRVLCDTCLTCAVSAAQGRLFQCASFFESHSRALVNQLSAVAVLSLSFADISDSSPCNTFLKDGVLITRHVPAQKSVLLDYFKIQRNAKFRQLLASESGIFAPLRVAFIEDGVVYVCDMPVPTNACDVTLEYLLEHPTQCSSLSLLSQQYNAVLPGHHSQLAQEAQTGELVLSPSYMHSAYTMASSQSLSCLRVSYEGVEPSLPLLVANPVVGTEFEYYNSGSLSEHQLATDSTSKSTLSGIAVISNIPVSIITAAPKDTVTLRTLAYYLDEGTVVFYSPSELFALLTALGFELTVGLQALYSQCQSGAVRNQLSRALMTFLLLSRVCEEKLHLQKIITQDYRNLAGAHVTDDSDAALLESYQRMMTRYDADFRKLTPYCVDEVKQQLGDNADVASIEDIHHDIAKELPQCVPRGLRQSVDVIAATTAPYSQLSTFLGRYSHLVTKIAEVAFALPQTTHRVRIIGEKVDQLVKRIRLTVNSIRLDRKKEQITVKTTQELLDKIGCGPKDALMLVVVAVQLTTELPQIPAATVGGSETLVKPLMMLELSRLCTFLDSAMHHTSVPTVTTFRSQFITTCTGYLRLSHSIQALILQYCFQQLNTCVSRGLAFLLQVPMNAASANDIFYIASSYLQNTQAVLYVEARHPVHELLQAPISAERNTLIMRISVCLWLFEIITLLHKLEECSLRTLMCYLCTVLLETTLDAPVPITTTASDNHPHQFQDMIRAIVLLQCYDLQASTITDSTGTVYAEQHALHPLSITTQWTQHNSSQIAFSTDLYFSLQKESEQLPLNSSLRTAITTCLALYNELRGVTSIQRIEHYNLLLQIQSTRARCNDNMALPYLLHQMDRITVLQPEDSFEYKSVKARYESIMKLTQPPSISPRPHSTMHLQLAKNLYQSLLPAKLPVRTILTHDPSKKHSKLGLDRVSLLLTQYTAYLSKKYE